MKLLFKNPILRKELQISSRSVKIPLVIMGYNLLLALMAIIAIAITNAASLWGTYDYSALSGVFPFIVCAEVGMIMLFVAIITGGSISGEREKQTLEVMLTTPMTPLSIAVGKMGAVIVKIMMFVISSIPILSIAFVLGGLSWLALLEFVGLTVFISIYVGSIGVFCSSLVKKSMLAMLLTILIGAAISILVLIIGIVVFSVHSALSVRFPDLSVGGWPLLFLFTPISVFVDFIARVVNAEGLAGMLDTNNNIPSIVIWLSRFWTILGIGVNTGVAALFLWLSTIAIGKVKK